MMWNILIGILHLVATTAQVEICPVSSIMDLNNTYNYFYPMDIYAPKELYLRAKKNKELYRCDADEPWEPRSTHFCSKRMRRFCPVHYQNVKDATAHKYHRSSSLCHFKAKLANKKEKIRLFVLGGSIVAGSGAQNCHKNYPVVEYHIPNHRCAWPYHFSEWLKQTSNASVSFCNLGMSGHDSYIRSLSLDDHMKHLCNSSQFSENDIILIDHSMNDQNQPIPALIEKGLEHLIRRIYSMSLAYSWPSIVVFDANPTDFFEPKEWLYPAAYEKIVRYYNLSMWSYREAVWSNYSRTHQKNISEYLRWNRNFEHDFHPTWHLHLFMADLYAAIFQSELQHCTEHLEKMALQLHHSRVPLTQVPALTLGSTSNECIASQSPLLSMSYLEHVNKIPFVGQYSVKPAGSWPIREDRPGQ